MSGTELLAGVDIGGTKCAVSLGHAHDGVVDIVAKRRFPTPATPTETLAEIIAALTKLLQEQGGATPRAIGVSCGGPLNSRAGLVLSPPNLPGWDRIDVVTPLTGAFGAPAGIQNDANAGALAEWRWGAGRGCRNVIFLTFGTGMGAGFILDGKLYSGTNDLAGEVGHVRLDAQGPVGYGKAGSFEGFCSGGGIARLARSMAEAALSAGRAPSFCPSAADLPTITAETVGKAAHEGDPLALQVWNLVGRRLAQGLALLVDMLNPERIVIGSIFVRQQALIEPVMRHILQAEALSGALAVCKVVPAGLGERVGDLASLAVALNVLDEARHRQT